MATNEVGRSEREKRKNGLYDDSSDEVIDIPVKKKTKKDKSTNNIPNAKKDNLVQQAAERLNLKNNAQDEAILIANLKEDLAAANAVTIHYKNRVKNISAENAKLKQQLKKVFHIKKFENKEIDTVDLGENTFISNKSLQNIKAFCRSAPSMARKLLVSIFTEEELRTCSLWGKKSNANKDRFPLRPGLDKTKLSSILQFTFEHFKISNDKYKMKEVKVSLASKLKELRKKINNVNAAEELVEEGD